MRESIKKINKRGTTSTSQRNQCFCRLHDIQHFKIETEHNFFYIQLDIALVVAIQKTDFLQFVTNGCRVRPRHVGNTGRQLIWHPSNRYSWSFFGLEQGWRTFLRAHTQISDNFRKNYFACGEPEFTSTTFP
jgi:hypothetical protein